MSFLQRVNTLLRFSLILYWDFLHIGKLQLFQQFGKPEKPKLKIESLGFKSVILKLQSKLINHYFTDYLLEYDSNIYPITDWCSLIVVQLYPTALKIEFLSSSTVCMQFL